MNLENKYKDAYLQYTTDPYNQENIKKIMEAIQPTVEKAHKTFGYGLPVLRAKAKLLAYNAIKTYDPSKGSLDGHLMLTLQRLRRFVPKVTNVVSVPEAVRMQAKALEEAEHELQDKYNRPPSDQEIADYTGLSLKKIKRLRTPMGSVAESVFDGNVKVDQVEQEQTGEDLWQEAIYKELSPTQQYIMERRFGLHGRQPETLEQISKNLNMATSSVHQQLNKINEKLQLAEEFRM